MLADIFRVVVTRGCVSKKNFKVIILSSGLLLTLMIFTVRSELRKVLFLAPPVCFFCV